MANKEIQLGASMQQSQKQQSGKKQSQAEPKTTSIPTPTRKILRAASLFPSFVIIAIASRQWVISDTFLDGIIIAVSVLLAPGFIWYMTSLKW